MQEKISLAGIVTDSITDGPGLRTVFFTQGCPHNCEGCHNPQTHPFDGGTLYSVQELKPLLTANPLLTGVTLSGGEPICQAKALLPLAKFVKEELKKELAIYSGYTFEQILSMGKSELELLKTADVLVDGKFVKSLRTLDIKFRGSSNQRVIDVQQSLTQNNVILETSDRWN